MKNFRLILNTYSYFDYFVFFIWKHEIFSFDIQSVSERNKLFL